MLLKQFVKSDEKFIFNLLKYLSISHEKIFCTIVLKSRILQSMTKYSTYNCVCVFQNVDNRPKYPILMRHEFYTENQARSDRDRVVRQWLINKKLLTVSSLSTVTQHNTKTAIHTPQLGLSIL